MIAADVAHVLNTPLPDVLAMPFSEAMAWHEQAARIASARWPTK